MYHMQNKIIYLLIQKADGAIASQRKEYDTEAMLKHVRYITIYCLKGGGHVHLIMLFWQQCLA